jgi:dTDP-glucose 4,6-dehydratase
LAVVRFLLGPTDHSVVSLDRLTYAGNKESIGSLAALALYLFIQGDIADMEVVGATFGTCQPDAVLHLAGESHVDRSIDGSAEFIQSYRSVALKRPFFGISTIGKGGCVC